MFCIAFGNFDAATKLMRRCSLVAVVFVFTSAAASLGQQKTVETGGRASSFGSTVTAEFPYLVGLTTGEIDDERNRQTAICTGTLISPTVVLSSAYCMSRLTTTYRESSNDQLFAYWKTPANSAKYHLVTKVYTHPSYDVAKRFFDLSLIKIKKPFKQVGRFVELSSKTFKSDVELSCVIVGIGAPHERGYKVPVRVRYGRTACRIPKSNPGFEELVGFTWEKFLCAETIGPTDIRLPCDRADPLMCTGGRYQYGIFSYGYNGTGSSPVTELTECGDPTVQSRHLFVNTNVVWITETMVKLKADQGGGTNQIDEDERTMTSRRRPTRPRPTTASTPAQVPEVSCVGHLEVNYPYLVYLEGLSDEPVCGGTLVSPRHVLTTAYCTTRMSEIVVTVTAYRRQRANAILVYIHPDFDPYTLTADISIVVLREPLNVTRYAQLPDIVSGPTDGNYTTKALDCVVVAASRQLTPYHYVPVNVKYGPKACRGSLDSEIQTTVNRTWQQFICGMLNRRLQNDTGDPLICDGLQYGIISHTYRTTKQATETESADQVRFLIVDNHRRWIDGVIALDTSDSHPNASPGLAVSLVVLHMLSAVFHFIVVTVEVLT